MKDMLIPTIGLEIHAELKTRTKMFCDSPNVSDEAEPNVNVCPVCMAHPGTLPTLNEEAIRHVLLVGKAVKGNLAEETHFDRKNYFYPDIPKGYQLSQYDEPLVSGGSLLGVAIKRIHLEEDTGSSIHDSGQGSLIDFNRAGVPLMELVTEPVIHDAETASKFGKELQILLRTLGVGEANMEKGEMRLEANISIAEKGKLGTKVEVKNLNSFVSVVRAITFEIARQSALVEAGKEVVQETRGWNEVKGITESQRLKETSADYRYFPDPDLPRFVRSANINFSDDSLSKSLPTLPDDRRRQYDSWGIQENYRERLVSDVSLAKFFDEIIYLSESLDKKIIANYLLTDVLGFMKGTFNRSNVKCSPKEFLSLIKLLVEGKLSSRGVKEIIPIIISEGGDPKIIAEKMGVIQAQDENKMTEVVKRIIDNNPKIVAEYKSGKSASIEFLLGSVMKDMKGSGNPSIIRELLKKHL